MFVCCLGGSQQLKGESWGSRSKPSTLFSAPHGGAGLGRPGRLGRGLWRVCRGAQSLAFAGACRCFCYALMAAIGDEALDDWTSQLRPLDAGCVCPRYLVCLGLLVSVGLDFPPVSSAREGGLR